MVHEPNLANQAFSRLLSIIAVGSQAERLSLVKLDGDTCRFFSDLLDPTTREASARSVRAYACLSTLIRTLWTLVPNRLLSAASPDFRSLARDALLERYGENDGFDNTVKALTIVFKRIRQYAIGGRRVSSLDLDLVSHQELLENQQERCNHCHYQFSLEYYRYAVEDDGLPSQEYEPLPGEVDLKPTYRKPELDHIVPFLLGGDEPPNWQILCASCNRGKSDLLTYFGGFNRGGEGRMSDLFAMTSGKRFAVLAEGEKPVGSVPNDGKFLRMFKKNVQGFLNRENLVARYE